VPYLKTPRKRPLEKGTLVCRGDPLTRYAFHTRLKGVRMELFV